MGFLGLIWLRWAKFFWVCKGGDGSVFLVVTTKIGYGTFFVFLVEIILCYFNELYSKNKIWNVECTVKWYSTVDKMTF